ncbi:hypothetical protein B0O99DRAFT_686122 [Bisporella sp. PMI_857]|nr:hypothetical protein B0O99DRAFT_686122 [Bisporella sp. PMI_857]
MSSISVDRTYKDTVVTLEDLKPDSSPGTTILSILHKPAISGTISNFLGVLVQDPSKPEETLFEDVATDNDVVHYPEYMEYYQPDQSSKAHAVQYITYEHLGGEPSTLSKNNLFVINGGFSFTDRAYVNRRYSEDGVELAAIWKEMFEPRGMPWERFNHDCIEHHRIHAKELDNYQKATYEDDEEISNYGRETEGYGEAVAHGDEISTARGTKQSREMTPTTSASHVEPIQNNATATVYTGKFYYKNIDPEVRARELTIYNRERMARRNRRLAQEKLEREQLARDEAGKEK